MADLSVGTIFGISLVNVIGKTGLPLCLLGWQPSFRSQKMWNCRFYRTYNLCFCWKMLRFKLSLSGFISEYGPPLPVAPKKWSLFSLVNQ